jgi:hypothetical protein
MLFIAFGVKHACSLFALVLSRHVICGPGINWPCYDQQEKLFLDQVLVVLLTCRRTITSQDYYCSISITRKKFCNDLEKFSSFNFTSPQSQLNRQKLLLLRALHFGLQGFNLTAEKSSSARPSDLATLYSSFAAATVGMDWDTDSASANASLRSCIQIIGLVSGTQVQVSPDAKETVFRC